MLCDKCKKNIATTHIHKDVNGVTEEIHLCSYCAAEDGYFNNNGIVDMLASMFGESLLLNPTATEMKCSCCGSTFGDIAKSGKAGCSECYKTFKKEFEPSLMRIHGKSKHIGKKPNRNSANTSCDTKETMENKLEMLKQELLEAINTENFEKAAKIRDKIKKIEGDKRNG